MEQFHLPTPKQSAAASLSIAILTTALLAPALIIAWLCKKIYRATSHK